MPLLTTHALSSKLIQKVSTKYAKILRLTVRGVREGEGNGVKLVREHRLVMHKVQREGACAGAVRGCGGTGVSRPLSGDNIELFYW